MKSFDTRTTIRVKKYLNEGAFVGVCNLKEDRDFQKKAITLKVLRILILQCLQLGPFLIQMEKLLLTYYKQADRYLKKLNEARARGIESVPGFEIVEQEEGRTQTNITALISKTDHNAFSVVREYETDELSFNNLARHEEEAFHIELALFVRILKDPKLLDGIPSYVNSRPIAMNMQLIETVAWLTVKKIMPL